MTTDPLTIPQGMTVDDRGDELNMTVSWSQPVMKLLFLALLLFLGFQAASVLQSKDLTSLIDMAVRSFSNDPFPLGLIGPTFSCIALWLGYFLVTQILNQTRITVSRSRLVIRHGPLPWPGNHDLAADSIQQVLAQIRLRGSRADGGRITHELLALTQDRHTIKLISGHKLSSEQALYIEKLLKARLRIQSLGIKPKTSAGSGAENHQLPLLAGNPAPHRATKTATLLRQTEDGVALEITQSWFDSRKILIAAFGLIWTLLTSLFAWKFLTGFYKTSSLAGITFQPQDYGLAIFPTVGLLILYVGIVGLVNRTKLTIGRKEISVRHGPLPWSSNFHFLLTDLKAVTAPKSLVAQLRQNMFGGVGPEIRAVMKDGSERRLISHFHTRDEALAVKQAIERYLQTQTALTLEDARGIVSKSRIARQ